MTSPRHKRLNADILESIKNPKNRNALSKCMERGRSSRDERLKTLPGGNAFQEEVKAIKERCIAGQEELLPRFIANAEARGAKVFLAKDGAAVAKYVIDLAQERGFKTVSKSKSLTTEEIELNLDLEAAELRVVETDLGELIIQLVGDKPYHLVFPSVHKMADDVAEIFTKETGKPVPNDIDEIMKVVRAYLRPIFLNTDIGMTGANIGIAESGAIVIETNEGNGRLVSGIGKCHVCVMGVEKIVSTVEDAMMMVLAHPVSASGQLPTTYVTWMGGRNPLGEGGAPRESHIIILDNGRGAMRDDPMMREALHCIRCAACMNICPTYGVVGGHTFGHIYPGPIGIPWTAAVHGLDKAGDFAELCISCGLCKEICPAHINMPMMIAEVKRRDMADNPPPISTRVLMQAERAAKMGSAFAPLSNLLLAFPPVRTIMEKTIGIDRRRKLPKFSRNTFAKQFHSRKKAPGLGNNALKVAFFHDLYANHNAPELAEAALAHLEALGAEVLVPEQRACGYPYIGYGDLDSAREAAVFNLARFAPLIRQGYILLSTEPTATYCFKDSYPVLLPGNEEALLVAGATQEFFAFLMTHQSKPAQPPLTGRTFGFHCSCHQRPMGAGKEAVAWLERYGATMKRIETGSCCGMGGTFGLKHGPLGYDLSMAVGEPLFRLFRDSGVEAIVTESSVCKMQLEEGTGLKVFHPLELVPQPGN